MTEGIDHRLRDRWTTDGPGATVVLPRHAVRWLRARTGLSEVDTPVASPSALVVPESTLPAAALAALTGVVGGAYVQISRAERLGRAGGLSYTDLLRHRGTGDLAVPDAVVEPADPDQVQQVLEVCVAHDVAVVPFGGGTSVVGGVAAERGGKCAVIALDLRRLDALVSVDPVSRIAVLGAGVRGPDAERLLGAHGLTLGHVPQSFERATIGGFAATRSAGQSSAGYGRFEDMVESVRLSTPAGQWRLGVAPASAAGPDLRALVVGSEGTLGVITEVGLRVRPVPARRRYEAWVLDGWQRGTDVVRELAQRRVLADVTRLSDVDETEAGLALRGGWRTAALRRYLRVRGVGEPCLLVLGWEAADDAELRRRRSAALAVVTAAKAVRLGRAVGESWRHGRFAGPRQRDALLDVGVCVETLETAAHWARLAELRVAVRDALVSALRGPGVAPIVMCHVSHAYETGASLYFTVLVPRSGDPVGQWVGAKGAACRAISSGSSGALGSSGPLGTISHHHGVGVDHAGYLVGEIGGVGVQVLNSVKRVLDPTGILNPGKLLL